MQVSQKSQYTLRALFELAKRQGGEPVTVAEIADAQAIPRRFLELILLGAERPRHDRIPAWQSRWLLVERLCRRRSPSETSSVSSMVRCRPSSVWSAGARSSAD